MNEDNDSDDACQEHDEGDQATHERQVPVVRIAFGRLELLCELHDAVAGHGDKQPDIGGVLLVPLNGPRARPPAEEVIRACLARDCRVGLAFELRRHPPHVRQGSIREHASAVHGKPCSRGRIGDLPFEAGHAILPADPHAPVALRVG